LILAYRPVEMHFPERLEISIHDDNALKYLRGVIDSVLSARAAEPVEPGGPDRPAGLPDMRGVDPGSEPGASG
jgi:hypothetical protein